MALASTIIAIASIFAAAAGVRCAARRAVPALFERAPIPAEWSGRLSLAINASVFGLINILAFFSFGCASGAITNKNGPTPGKGTIGAAAPNPTRPIARPMIRVGDEYV